MSLINFGNGLSAMGQAISNSAGAAEANLQKAQLQEQKLRLASQLAGQQYDVQSKRLAAIPQMMSTDAYLKATGHPGGLADFGFQMPGPDAPASQPAATIADSSSDAVPAQIGNDSTASSDSEGTATASAESPALESGHGSGGNNVAVPNGPGIITPIGDKGKVLGMALPPGWTPKMAMVAGPTGLAAAWAQWSKPSPVRAKQALTYFDFATGKQRVLYQQPDLPPGALFDPETNSIVQTGNANQVISNAAYARSQGESQGALSADLAKIGAHGAQARETAGFQKGLDVATNLIPSYNPETQKTVMITQADALKMAKAGGGPVTPPGDAGKPEPSNGGIGLQKDGSYKTADGTIIPPAPSPARNTSGVLQAAPSVADKATQESYAPIIKGWEDSVVPSEMGEQRFQAIASAMKATQMGVWAERKYDFAQMLGIPELAGTDVAQAQIILKNNFGAALNTMATTHGLSRFTQNELFATQKNLPAIGNQPAANLAIIAQAIGTARFQRNLANDWNQARQLGYSDPLTYQAAWMKANPLQGFIDQAKNEIGPLKGMASQYPTPPAAAVQELKTLGPSAKGHFDEIFGPGAAEKVLGQ